MARSRHKHVHRRRAARRRLARVGLATSAVLAAAAPVVAVVWSEELSSFVSPEATATSNGRARTAPAPMRLAAPPADDLVMLADRRPDARPDESEEDTTAARDRRSRESRSRLRVDATRDRAVGASHGRHVVPSPAAPAAGPARAVATTTPTPSSTPTRTASSAPARSTSTQTTTSRSTSTSVVDPAPRSGPEPTAQVTTQVTAEPTPTAQPTTEPTTTTTDVTTPGKQTGRICPPARGKGSTSAATGCTGSLP